MKLQVGVKILLKNPEGKYLLLERSLEKYPDIKERWDIPGGRINPGRSLLENLEREVQEETGLAVAGKPRLIAAQDIFTSNGSHVVRLTYLGEVSRGEPVLQDEHVGYQWFSVEEIRALGGLDGYFREVLESLRF